MYYIYRDAQSGQIVTKAYALANPTTTVKEKVDSQETDERGDLFHDEKTMSKFHDALIRAGVTGINTRIAIITEVQNASLLIRERGKF